jgi:hypothetical protein
MHQDNERGGTVKWVALLGFSQGTKIAASLLYRQRLREEAKENHHVRSDFRFGVLFAGRAPLVSLDFASNFTSAMPSAAEITGSPDRKKRDYDGSHVLRILPVNVHGSRDKGLHLHQHLFEDFCDPVSRRLVMQDGAHHLPL